MIIKKNGDREEYDRKKIEQSFRIACNKRPIAEVIIQESISIIEDTILESNKMEIDAEPGRPSYRSKTSPFAPIDPN